ncbi:MAG TPA: S53 family peptidase [Jatrophihabitans sp.]|nr:S53 family peptidase [Jatrophihabitans sp.]
MTTDAPDPPDLHHRPLAGSARPPAPNLANVEPLDPDEQITITLILRRRAEVPDEVLTNPISRDELAGRYGADPADVEQVSRVLTGLGARVEEADAASRRLRVTGSVGVLGRIFATTLERATSQAPSGAQVTHRHRTGELSVPADLDGLVTAVLGLDDRPQARAKFRLAGPQAAQGSSYTPPQLGALYSFPAGTDGSGQSIAIVELGGGFDQADLTAYFSGLGITGPSVTAVGVDGATNVPGKDPQGADGEVLLDIEVVGALAPAASILVYFAPNTDSGFVNAVSQAAHANPAPVAMSISWGQSEDDWTAQGRAAVDQALVDAAALGVTVTVASGDDGSTDRATDGRSHVDFPAASPHALACGGTRLAADGSGQVGSETVWNDGPGNGASGGGVSDTFGLPTWQQQVGVPSVSGKAGRGVPDVAGDADPQTGYQVRVDGNDLVIGGTSAVAPLWAALVARLAQATGRRFGLIQPALYGSTAAGATAPGFRDITSGDNGAYQAGPGWDPCTGLGVPVGTALLTVLQRSG